MARFFSSQMFCLAVVFTSFYTPCVQAATRAILIPGRSAIFIMEGMSSAGFDPDVRRLYSAIGMTPIQQSGGEAKVMKTASKDFTLTCGTRNSSPDSIVCNITVRPSTRASVDFSTAEIHVDGAEAADLNEKLATKPGGHFEFESTDHKMKIESSVERFDFTFHQ